MGVSLAVTMAVVVLLTLRPARRPNILLVTIDTIRADHCSTYGYGRRTTPTLSRVAAQGVLLRSAYAPMATTGPSHASMFTSLYPRSHGFIKNGYVLEMKLTTLAETLAAAGYRTAAIVSSFPVDGRFGFEQGFELFDDDFAPYEGQAHHRRWEGLEPDGAFDQDAVATTEEAVHWLRRERMADDPFFLWVHYFDPHIPYEPAEPYRDLFAPSDGPLEGLERTIALYDAEIRETDDALGRLLAALHDFGLAQSTLLVIAGDHGEGLMQHGHMEHGPHLYEEAVRVPLLFRWPEVLPAGLQLSEPVELLDLMPTILDLTGVRHDRSSHQGISIAEALTLGRRLDPDREVFLQRRRYKQGKIDGVRLRGDKLGVLSGGWKYIEAPDEGLRELYDLTRDPGETNDVHASYPERAELMRDALRAWTERVPAVEPTAGRGLSPRERARLEALGYVQ